MTRAMKLGGLALAVVLVVALGVVAAVYLLNRGGGKTAEGMRITFDGQTPYANHGNPDLHATLATNDGGVTTFVPSHDGSQALRLPTYTGTPTPPRAVLVVNNDQSNDLSPRSSDFVFGADFKIDALSLGSAMDNGDNLIQRGLWVAPIQYKIEVDHDKPTCRIMGDGGAVQVRSFRPILPDQWYRATCERKGDNVTLTVEQLPSGKTWTYSGSGKMGSLNSTSIPLTVGGKVDSKGQLVGPSDQFNGVVDNPFYRVLG